MKQAELALFYAYIHNNRLRLKNDIRSLQANLRFREIDTVDCLELILAVERYNTFKDTTNQIRHLLNLDSMKIAKSPKTVEKTDLQNDSKGDIIGNNVENQRENTKE